MNYFIPLVILLSNCFLLSLATGESHRYQEKHITLPLDHFTFVTDKTFQLRYLINDTFTRGNPETPILFYCGGEADIEIFAKSIGFVWEFAPKINGLVVFAEHRYYGKSLPFGNDSMKSRDQFGYLSIEQTLADFAALIDHLNKASKMNRPVIAVGGSYGGILAAFFRMKYPHLVAGALAASAPLKQFSDLTPCDAYSKVITRTFKTAYNEHCSSNVKKSWTVFRNVAEEENGVDFFNSVFNFCNPWKYPYEVVNFIDTLRYSMYFHMAMTNFPYESDFYTFLPANPIRKLCSHLDIEFDGHDLVRAFRRALDVYANPKGDKKCFEFPKRSLMQEQDRKAWHFQRCSELITGECDIDSDDNMFPPGGDNYRDTILSCKSTYGTWVDEGVNRINNHFGIEKLGAASNIILSNGLMDPWSAASVLKPPNDQTIVINIPEGAHHIDLRHSNEMDPLSVTQARQLEQLYLKKWIRQFRRKMNHFM